MQKIDLFGMELKDYPLRESLDILDDFLNNGALNTILYISAKMLVGANISDEQKEWIQAVDLIVWSDSEVLKHAGITARNRIHEVENREFFREFLRRMGRKKRTVYLLGETEEELELLRGDLLHFRGDLNIVGMSAVTEETDLSALANRINIESPTAIISRIVFSRQEKLMVDMKPYLHAEVWLALNKQMTLNEERPAAVKKILNKWYHHIFKRQAQKYKSRQKGS